MLSDAAAVPTVLTVPSVPRSVAAVRRFARGVCDGVSADVSDTVALLVSEVATNAMVHGTGTVRVAVHVTDDVVRVEVGDESPVLPTPKSPGWEAEGGRGLALVEALASSWGSTPSPLGGGKVVWFELPGGSARP